MTKQLCLLLIFLLVVTFNNNAQQSATVYYLIIGSAHYSLEYEKYSTGFNGLLNLEAAETSANKMAVLLDSFGAVYGKTIITKANKLLLKHEFFKAVDEIVLKVKNDKKKNPFIVFYYAGHGFSCPQFEGLFLPPGNFVQNPELLDLEKWSKYGIAPLDIHEKFQQAKINHMMLLDCCYEGRQQPDKLPDQSVVKGLGIENVETLMKQTYEILKAMNRMVGPDPVIFSAPVDVSVVSVPMPYNDNEYVGPLCRKAYLVWEKVGKEKLSIKQFTSLLTAKDLDNLTIPAVTYASFDAQNEQIFKQK